MRSLNRFKEVEVDFFNYHAVDIIETLFNTQNKESLNEEIRVLEEKLQLICSSYRPAVS